MTKFERMLVGVIFLFLIALPVMAYLRWSGQGKGIELGALIVAYMGSVGTIGGLAFLAKQTSLQTQQKRIEASFAVLSHMNSSEFHKIEANAEKALRQKKGSKEGARLLLGYYEDLAIGIRKEYYDESILLNSLEGVVSSVWSSYKGVAFDIRKREKDDTYYEEIEKLAKRWADKS